MDRTHGELTDEDVARIANTYHAWRGENVVGAGLVPAQEGWARSRRGGGQVLLATLSSTHAEASSRATVPYLPATIVAFVPSPNIWVI